VVLSQQVIQMKLKWSNIRIGLRTIKTAAAVVLSMLLVNIYGFSTSKLIFAMLGAMAAVQPTFKESLESALTQIVGVSFGAVMGVLLLQLPIQPLVAAGIGIILVIMLYNTLQIRFSPSLACLIVVTLCTDRGIQPMVYAVERIWDTTIGLSVGMFINTLIFPYDNSRQIRATVQALDRELITFLENMFDGDEIMPDAQQMVLTIEDMERQMQIFSNQKLFLHLRAQHRKIAMFRSCEGTARELLSRLIVLSRVERPGILSEESRQLLRDCGAEIRDHRQLTEPTELDIVTNYHIKKILALRDDLLSELET
jgi:uncharacterized membrane protein YgaE (UPF0421/DUF939 family)